MKKNFQKGVEIMLLKNGIVFMDNGAFAPGDILIRDGKFAAVGQNLAADDEQVIDLQGKKVLPGLIDIHTHGCGMKDFCEGTPEAFDTLAAGYIKNGITTVCPTSMTLPPEQLEKIYSAYNDWMETDHPGSRLIGINMEGPFISIEKKGAHRAEYVIPADIDIFNRLNKASGNRIRLVDVAPEMEGNMAFIRAAKDICTVSVAHTDATYEQVMEAYAAGATSTTHLFNAMSGFFNRSPGTVGAVFDSDAYAELICDGEHVHPPVIRTVVKLLGPDRLIVISDSLMAAGMPEGTVCKLGVDEAVIKGGKAVLPNGTIAGSVVNILEEIRRLMSFGIDEITAIKCSTINPAKAIGIDHLVGSITPGKLADILVLNPDYTPYMVLRDGIRQKIN